MKHKGRDRLRAGQLLGAQGKRGGWRGAVRKDLPAARTSTSPPQAPGVLVGPPHAWGRPGNGERWERVGLDLTH